MNITMVFFSKNKKTAIARLNKLSKRDKFYKDKEPILAKDQIKHGAGWKTWKIRKK